MAIFSAIMFLGLLATFLVPETKGKSLEEITEGKSATKEEQIM